MQNERCPVCGGKVDPKRLAETCVSMGAEKVAVVETIIDRDIVCKQMMDRLHELDGVALALSTLESGAKAIFAVSLFSMIFGGLLFVVERDFAGGMILAFGIGTWLLSRTIRPMAEYAMKGLVNDILASKVVRERG